MPFGFPRTAFRARLPFLFAASLALSSTSQALPSQAAGPAKPDAPIARVGSVVITAATFQAEMQRRGLTGPGVTLQHKQALLDELIRNEAIAQKARAEGYESSPEIQAALKRLLVDKYHREHIEPKLAAVSVSDEDAAAYYQSHLADYTEPERHRAALVKVAVSARVSDDARAGLLKRAEDAAAAMRDPKVALGTVVAKYSEDQATRYVGGDMGWLSRGRTYRWPGAVADAAFALEPGQVSAVIKASDGFYVVKLLEKVGTTVRPLAEVRPGIKHLLLQQRRADVDKALTGELRKALAVNVDAAALGSVSVPKGSVLEGERQPPAVPGKQ